MKGAEADLGTADPHASSSGHAGKARDSRRSPVSAITVAALRPRPPVTEVLPGPSPRPPAPLPPHTGALRTLPSGVGPPRTPVVTPNTDPTGPLEAEERAGRTAPCAPPGAPAMCARLRGNVWTGAASLRAPHARPPTQVVPRRSPWPHRPQRARWPGHWQPGLEEASVSRGQDAAGRTLVLLRDSQPWSPCPPALGAARAAQRGRFSGTGGCRGPRWPLQGRRSLKPGAFAFTRQTSPLCQSPGQGQTCSLAAQPLQVQIPLQSEDRRHPGETVASRAASPGPVSRPPSGPYLTRARRRRACSWAEAGGIGWRGPGPASPPGWGARRSAQRGVCQLENTHQLPEAGSQVPGRARRPRAEPAAAPGGGPGPLWGNCWKGPLDSRVGQL